jgi:hypothetical protein
VSPAATQSVVGGGSVDYTVHAGTYAVGEALLAGWDMTGNTCTNIAIGNGETKECTITNTKKGHLIVDKVTVPALATTSFAIAASGTGTITGGGTSTVTDATNKDYEVTPGTYGVAETVPTGWDQTSNTCSNVAIAAGETKTCVITNTKRANITVVKDAQPNDLADFVFTSTGNLGSFTLDDDGGVADIGQNGDVDQAQSKTFTNVVPGAYTFTETQPNQFWILKSAACVLTGTATPVGATLVGNALTVAAAPGADITCTFVNEKQSPTRTQGFWQTHTDYTTGVFTTKFLPTGMTIGTAVQKTINSAAKLFGAYYSNIAKKTTNQQRSALDKARMQLLQQLVTAKLNCSNFGCASSVQSMIAAADVAYAGTNVSAIIAAAGQLDLYNNSGDTLIIGNAGKATPKTSQSIADKLFWDITGL